MRIYHNLAALNTYRSLSINASNTQKSIEKLSSGLRINRAGDDAAGLAISEKMRGQIRGLNQASRNAQDGISMIQTAEGALNETQSILQRMRELAVQSANDTNVNTDRSALQNEVDQLAQELTRIAENTEFNTQKLLDGTFTEKLFHIGSNEGQSIAISVNKMDADALGVAGAQGLKMSITTGAVNAVGADETAVVGAAAETFGALGDAAGTDDDLDAELTVVKLAEAITISDAGGITAQYALKNADGDIVAVSSDGNKYAILEAATAEENLAASTGILESAADTPVVINFGTGVTVTSGTVTVDFTDVAGSATDPDTMVFTASEAVVAFTNNETRLVSGTYTVVAGTHNLVPDTELGLVDSKGNLVAISNDTAAGLVWENMAGEALFTIPAGGTNALTVGETITISSSGGIDISTQEAADHAITTINDAITTVSNERAKLGAMQNRLEHTINNLGTSAENLTAAESRIRDLDMASEMMEFTKNNILNQAAQAMLAQANQQPQGILQLLR